MKKILLYLAGFIILALGMFLLIIFTQVGLYLYELYEPVVLAGHYVGETRAAYYHDFLLTVVLPASVVISACVLLGMYKINKSKNKA